MSALSRICAVLTVALLAASPAYAASIVLNDSYGNTNGGEFRAVPTGLSFVPIDLTGGQTGQFQTFCIEKNEYFSFGTSYFVGLSTTAVHGGVGGGDPDPLSPLTAYLFTKFATASLVGYTYTVGDGGVARAASADALQHVIWYIEQEEDKTWTDGDNSLSDKFYQDALANAGANIGNVRVLNLWGDAAMTSSPAQDQLVLTPEPSAIVAAVLGLGLLGWTRRRA